MTYTYHEEQLHKKLADFGHGFLACSIKLCNDVPAIAVGAVFKDFKYTTYVLTKDTIGVNLYDVLAAAVTNDLFSNLYEDWHLTFDGEEGLAEFLDVSEQEVVHYMDTNEVPESWIYARVS